MAVKGGAVQVIQAVVTVAAPPAVLALVGKHWIGTHPVISVALLLVYWLVLGIARFAGQIWEDLRGGWASQISAWINQVVLWRLSQFERNYRNLVEEYCRYADQTGLLSIGAKAPELDDVFVDVSLAPRPPQQISGGILPTAAETATRGPSVSAVRQSVWDFLGDGRSRAAVLAVIGAPGSGKTTLLQHIARHPEGKRRQRHRTLPVLLPLRECVAAITSDPAASLPTVIVAYLERLTDPPPVDWFGKRLASGCCVVMLDGLDEVAHRQDRQEVVAWVRRQITRYPRNDFVITSRPHGYRDNPLTGATVLQVREFTPAQMASFVRRWYFAADRWRTATDGAEDAPDKADDLLRRLDLNPALTDLAVNPLLLTMIANVHCYRGELPQTRDELYAEMCLVLLDKRQLDKNLAEPPLPGVKEAVLRDLALTMMTGRTSIVARDRAVAAISQSLASVPVSLDPAILLANIQATGLLLEPEREGYCFAHHTFQEYLAAACINDPDQVMALVDNVNDPWWRETILLYAARAGAGPIVEACLASGQFHALTLAFDCADADRGLAPSLRRRLDALLSDAADSTVSPERRRLATAVTATGQLRHTFRLTNGTRVCSAPVTQHLYELFTYQKRGEYPERASASPAVPASTARSEAAVSVTATDALDFVEWLNDLLDEDTVYRLPTLAETGDPRFYGNPAIRSRCVWLVPNGDSAEPGLWSAPGTPHPYAVSARELRDRSEADAAGPIGRLLATILAFALAHALATADMLALADNPARARGRALAVQFRDELERVREFSLELIGMLAPGSGSTLGLSLASSLDPALAYAGRRDLADGLAQALGAGTLSSHSRALAQALDFTRARACDIASELRIVAQRALGREFTVSISRPGGRTADPAGPGNLAVNRALDHNLDQALAHLSEPDLDLPLCMLFARNAPTARGPREMLDLIWGPVLDAVAARGPERVILPDLLHRLSRDGCLEIRRTISGPGHEHLGRRMAAVAARINDLVPALDENGAVTSSQFVSYVRLGALAVAAGACRLDTGSELAQRYVDVAVSVTAFERRMQADATRNEAIVLVCG
jgi:hypothetical protein